MNRHNLLLQINFLVSQAWTKRTEKEKWEIHILKEDHNLSSQIASPDATSTALLEATWNLILWRVVLSAASRRGRGPLLVYLGDNELHLTIIRLTFNVWGLSHHNGKLWLGELLFAEQDYPNGALQKLLQYIQLHSEVYVLFTLKVKNHFSSFTKIGAVVTVWIQPKCYWFKYIPKTHKLYTFP